MAGHQFCLSMVHARMSSVIPADPAKARPIRLHGSLFCWKMLDLLISIVHLADQTVTVD